MISMMGMLEQVRNAERAIASIGPEATTEDYDDLVADEEEVKPPLWWLPPRSTE